MVYLVSIMCFIKFIMGYLPQDGTDYDLRL